MARMKDILISLYGLEWTAEELQAMVYEVNSENGNLEYLNYYENDEDFFNTFFSDNPMDVARATFYGDYNFMHDYVTFNGYGNLETITAWELEEILQDEKDNIINEYIEVYDRRWSSVDLSGKVEEKKTLTEDEKLKIEFYLFNM